MSSVRGYLLFGGCCEEAIEFYKRTIQAELEFVMRFRDSPVLPPGIPDDFDEKIMHATMRIGESTFMLADGSDQVTRFEGFRMALTVESESQAEQVFEALSDGGTVDMPLAKTF